jgi:hypothetical protein
VIPTTLALIALALFAILGARWCRAIDRRNADAEWAAICAAYGTTPEAMRALRENREQTW